MNFFNIGTAELLLIFVIALIVVGPRRLPELAKSFGKIVGDVRKMSQEFTAQITQELDAIPKEDEIRELIAPIEEVMSIEPADLLKEGKPKKAAAPSAKKEDDPDKAAAAPAEEGEPGKVAVPSAEEGDPEKVATSQDVSEKEAHEDQSQ